MKRATLLLFALLATGCSHLPYTPEFEVLAGKASPDGDFQPSDAVTTTFRLRQRFDADRPWCRQAIVEVQHMSHWTVGWPFNSKSEDSFDHIAAGCSWGGKRR